MKKQIADLVLENARVITCDPLQPQAEAVAIKGEHLILVGNRQEIQTLKAKGTRTIDCQEKFLVPGFNDAHCHIFPFLRKLFSLDLNPQAVSSIREIQGVIRGKAQDLPKGQWIRGTDYNEFYLAEKRHPTRWDLDLAAPNHPVILYHRSSHACILNSEALRFVGISNETEEPEGGMIERDLATGQPNGILYEMGPYLNQKIESGIPGAKLEPGMVTVNQNYLSQGITSLGEASVNNNLEQWHTFQDIVKADRLKSRIYFMVGWQYFDEFRRKGLTTGTGNDKLKIGSLKVLLSEARGNLQPSQEVLNQIVLEANRSGFQVAIHAVERTTMEAAVNALEWAGRRYPSSGLRNRIEHGSECPPDIIRRLSRLKTLVASQPPFIYYSGERYLSQVDPKAQKWLYPFKSLLDADLKVAGSSDSPVAPNNPLIGIYAVITRKAESGQTVLIDEAITPQQALEMYTIHAAYASGEEKIKGSLSPGKLADIVMLSADPLHSPPEIIKKIRVEMTIIGGEVVWESTSQK